MCRHENLGVSGVKLFPTAIAESGNSIAIVGEVFDEPATANLKFAPVDSHNDSCCGCGGSALRVGDRVRHLVLSRGIRRDARRGYFDLVGDVYALVVFGSNTFQ